MKKILLAVGIGCLLISATIVRGALGTVTYTLGGAKATNTISGPVTVRSITLSADGTNQNFVLLDAPGLYTTNYVGSFASYTQYATNYITTWTNYFGLTNSVTNVVLYTNWSTTAAITNTWAAKATGSAISNTSAIFNNVNAFFLNGILATNTSTSGNGTLTINYEK